MRAMTRERKPATHELDAGQAHNAHAVFLGLDLWRIVTGRRHHADPLTTQDELVGKVCGKRLDTPHVREVLRGEYGIGS